MPTSANLIEAQRYFEEARGLDKFNTIEFALNRTRQELDEAVHAYHHETPEHFLYELIDMNIFLHSILGTVAADIGITPEQVDQMIEAKMAVNHAKYDLAFFQNGHDTATAITLARHWHNLGLHEERLGNDYY